MHLASQCSLIIFIVCYGGSQTYSTFRCWSNCRLTFVLRAPAHGSILFTWSIPIQLDSVCVRDPYKIHLNAKELVSHKRSVHKLWTPKISLVRKLMVLFFLVGNFSCGISELFNLIIFLWLVIMSKCQSIRIDCAVIKDTQINICIIKD